MRESMGEPAVWSAVTLVSPTPPCGFVKQLHFGARLNCRKPPHSRRGSDDAPGVGALNRCGWLGQEATGADAGRTALGHDPLFAKEPDALDLSSTPPLSYPYGAVSSLPTQPLIPWLAPPEVIPIRLCTEPVPKRDLGQQIRSWQTCQGFDEQFGTTEGSGCPDPSKGHRADEPIQAQLQDSGPGCIRRWKAATKGHPTRFIGPP